MRKFKTSKKQRGTYIYRFVDGTTTEIEVNDEVSPQDIAFLYQLDDEEVDRDRREQYHVPYFYDEVLAQEENKGTWTFQTFLDEQTPLTTLLEQENSIEREKLFVILHESIEKLTAKQQETIDMIFRQGLSKAEIAKKEGISKAAVTYRTQGIYKKLKADLTSYLTFSDFFAIK